MVEAFGEESDETADSIAPAAPMVECLGARNELDDVAAMLLVRLLGERGIAARMVPARHWMSEPRLGRPATQGTSPKLICLSHLGTASAPRLRLLTRRLRRRSAPDAKLLLGLWSGQPRYDGGQPEMPDFMDDIATSLSEAADEIADRLSVGKGLATAHGPHHGAPEARSAG